MDTIGSENEEENDDEGESMKDSFSDYTHDDYDESELDEKLEAEFYGKEIAEPIWFINWILKYLKIWNLEDQKRKGVSKKGGRDSRNKRRRNSMEWRDLSPLLCFLHKR